MGVHRGLVKHVSFLSLYVFKEKHLNVSFSKILCAHCSCDRLSKLPESSCGQSPQPLRGPAWNPSSPASRHALNSRPHVPTSSRSESPTRTRAEGAAHRLTLIVPVQFAPRHAAARGPLGSATQHLPGDGSHLCTGHHAAASVGQGLSVRGAPWWLPRSVLCSHGSCTRGHTHVIHRVERCADTSPGHSEADGAALGIGQSHGGWRKDVRML